MNRISTKDIILSLRNVPRKLHNRILDYYAVESYSQEGEDMIMRRIFENTYKGFYVDVGAHHPKRFSNTYLFYKKGWSGINIDATPGSMELFKKIRPRDINIEAAIANDNREISFFIFNEPALNSFDKNLAFMRNKDVYKIIDIKKIYTKTLAEVLDEYLPMNQKINFLSIDVEGFDMEVLLSNDWINFRPEYILIEIIDIGMYNIEDNKIHKLLNEQGYLLFAKTLYTVIYRKFDEVVVNSGI